MSSINSANQLFGFGGVDGVVEFWHPRQRKKLGSIDVSSALLRFSDTIESPIEITALTFANDGLHFSVGTSSGHVLNYDLRRPTPLLIKDHQYGFPIKDICYHSSEKILSSDTKIVKIWNRDDVILKD